MLSYFALQIAGPDVMVAGMVLLVLAVSVALFAVQRRSIGRLRDAVARDPKIEYDMELLQKTSKSISESLTGLQAGLMGMRQRHEDLMAQQGSLRDRHEELVGKIPHTGEITAMQENVAKLCADFSDLRSALEERMTKFQQSATENLDGMKRQIQSDTGEELRSIADGHIRENSVTREEFDRMQKRISSIMGGERLSERIELLAQIFDANQIKTLNWQCTLVKLLKGGLAPEAEEDLIISNGIPQTAFRRFLGRLEELGIASSKRIRSFWIEPEHEWIYAYTSNPDQLQAMLKDSVKKEKEYQDYIRKNLGLVEAGLQLEVAEYELDTGRLDFLCRDSSGRPAGLELKYPAAQARDKRQIAGYRDDYVKKTGYAQPRFMIVAPKITDELKKLLKEDGFGWKEVQF